MLEQKYLTAKYGLAPFQNQAVTTSVSVAADAQQTSLASVSAESQRKASIPPADGPLGLAEGLKIDEIEGMTGSTLTLVNQEQNLYSTSTPPRPNSAFETIALVISPTVGLCQIRALSKDINTNSFGHQIQSQYEEMRDALNSVYGKGKTFDALMPGSLWKDSDEWMMGLYKKDRFLSTTWKSTPSAPLKSHVSMISMEARANSTSKAYYLVQYDFSNYSVCEAEEKNNKTGSL
ncbi:hypothetical protein D3C78_1141190 [compost metagenome]